MDHRQEGEQERSGDGGGGGVNGNDFAMVNRAVQQRGARELKVEDALLYLDQVKIEFSDQPKIYNEFLEIMKNFKAQSITTPGVIDQVKNLFRGHNKLILGFNAFLPEGEGYKIELSPEEEAYPQHLQQQHAISYVTNIRNRFANEPEIYKAFLKILHTYQREQRGIKDVLDQVSALFYDHPDLLMDFTYFLPDAVQEQAKERLRATVTEIEMKKRSYTSQKRKGDHRYERDSKSSKTSHGDGSGTKKARKKDMMAAAAAAAQQYDEKDKGNNYVHPYHTISTERKFFDQMKDLLTSSSRDAWTEFVKSLDLFSHEALSKREVLVLAQELLGSGNDELLEEFRALISSKSAYDSSKQDIWFSLPLTEIDFSQCRKCTPSYRILPSDYPKRICSGRRGHLEASVLNDEWVSIPIGSEESFSFKQMRKNQFEEAIFRSEDERFEVDMIIDSNCTCIRVLEAMAEEFSRIRVSDDSLKVGVEFDKPSLGTIHLNVISRLYGEHGHEILEALRRNPIGTIPVVLKRLKQKDLEWREARRKMQIQWKETLMKNYDKSLDHRSYIFKPQDKRSYITRFLVTDIKDANSADVKEGRIPQVSYSCSPEILSLCKGMQPQLFLSYGTADRIALLDAYNLLTYAAETSGCTSIEKERMSALWRDLFRVIFNMPIHFLFTASSVDKLQQHYSATAAASAATTSAGDGHTKRGKGTEEQDSDRRTTRHEATQLQHQLFSSAAHVFWPIGTRVVTVYGTGSVVGIDRVTGIHEVNLGYGRGFFSVATIVGAESLSNNALDAIGVSRNEETGQEAILDVATPHDPPEHRVFAPSSLLYGTQMCYLFLRLHHTLTLRLAEARRLATTPEKTFKKPGSRYLSSLSCATDTEDLDDETDLLSLGADRGTTTTINQEGSVYASYLSQLYSFIDGSLDLAKYEDNTRNILGNRSYPLFTIDKIVQQCIKCLQALSSDDITHRLVGIFLYHNFSSQSRHAGVCPSLYREHVANCLQNTLEEVYRLQFITPDLHTSETVVACQYLGVLAPHDSSPSLNKSSLLDSAQKAPKLVLDDEEDDPHDFLLTSLATAASHDPRLGDRDHESEEEGGPAAGRHEHQQQHEQDQLHPRRRSRRHHRGAGAGAGGSDREDDLLSLSVTSSPPVSHLDESSQPPPSPLTLQQLSGDREGQRQGEGEDGKVNSTTVLMAAFNDILEAAAGVEAESVAEMKEQEDLSIGGAGAGAIPTAKDKKKAKSSSKSRRR